MFDQKKSTTTEPTTTESTTDAATRQRRAYLAGGRVTRERLRAEAPLDAEVLAAVHASDIVVVNGVYDHVGQVLDGLELPFTAIDVEAVEQVRLRPEQLLVVNCPGQLSGRSLKRVRKFVEAGGSLFTTDWALRHVIEPAFPGLVEYNSKPTKDDVVRVEVCAHDNPFLRGVIDDGDDPQWWLEGSSYPIRVLDPRACAVLIRSRELEARYGEAPVAVQFDWGDGEVFHMVSHYYLQRTELRNARHRMRADEFVAGKGVALTAALYADLDGLVAGEVESAASSTRFLANVVSQKQHKIRRLKEDRG